MPRIDPIALDKTDEATATALSGVKAKLGFLPNLFTTLAREPAALEGYLKLSGALAKGRLTARQRELIAIAIAQENECGYCLSAHSAIGRQVGLGARDIQQARLGNAEDITDRAAVRLALSIVRSRATVSDAELAEAHRAGLDDGLIVEIIAQVALNVLTNYVNRVADTDVDFPVIGLSTAA